MIRFSLIVPTSGRPSLYEVLHGAWAGGLTRDDEVIVVADGEQPEARRISGFWSDRLQVHYVETPPTLCVGMAQRNHGMTLATGTHLTFMDDDDRYTKDAFRVMRATVERNPDRLHAFRIKAVAKRLQWNVIWDKPVAREGNVGSPTLVVPNVKEKLGTWGERYAGDADFVVSTVRKHKQPPVWCPHVIAEIR